MRLRAIACALWYGLLPWQLYERECHYRPWGYWRHLAHNLGYALRWTLGKQSWGDMRFEARTNGSRKRSAPLV